MVLNDKQFLLNGVPTNRSWTRSQEVVLVQKEVQYMPTELRGCLRLRLWMGWKEAVSGVGGQDR